MSTAGSRAGRALARLRRSYTITCKVCGREAVRKHPKAKRCGRLRCLYQARKQRRDAKKKEAQK